MRIEMFGGLRALQGDLSLRLHSRQAETLLAILALAPGRDFVREDLARRLWPETSPERALQRFKREFSHLRRSLDRPASPLRQSLFCPSGEIRIHPAELTTDVSDFERLLGCSQASGEVQEGILLLEKALQHVQGPLLPGCYDPYILQERERLHQAYGSALHRLALLYAGEGQMMRAVQAAHSAVRSDPLQEEACLTLIQLCLRSGLPVEAQAQIDAFQEILRQELGEKPSPALASAALQAQRFATQYLSTSLALRSLSAPLHKLLHALAQGEAANDSLELLDCSDLFLLENIAFLEEKGLVSSEPSRGVMRYRLLPELEALLLSPL